MAQPAAAVYHGTPTYFPEVLEDAEQLLKYATENGVEVDDATRRAVLSARTASVVDWNENIAENLLKALTSLAAKLKPVTARSLKECLNTRPTVHIYWKVAVCLAIFIVPFSLASFLSTAIADAIRKDITTSNDLAVKLTSQLELMPTNQPDSKASNIAGTAAQYIPRGVSDIEILSELQQFAATIRAIDSRARQLDVLILFSVKDPFQNLRTNNQEMHKIFQLPVGFPRGVGRATEDKIMLYQDVRSFAQGVLDNVSFFYSAIATCLLPVLYALLGTCAYLLRCFEEQMRTLTFVPSPASSSRFLIAAIGGAVVGLFNSFTLTQGASIPPLAIAFLVGYAVDVFFSFLESLLQTFTKNTTRSPGSTLAGN